MADLLLLFRRSRAPITFRLTGLRMVFLLIGLVVTFRLRHDLGRNWHCFEFSPQSVLSNILSQIQPQIVRPHKKNMCALAKDAYIPNLISQKVNSGESAFSAHRNRGWTNFP